MSDPRVSLRTMNSIIVAGEKQQSVNAIIESLELEEPQNTKQLEARLAGLRPRAICNVLLGRIERPGIKKTSWSWMSPALTALGCDFLDLNRARRIARNSRNDILAQSLALEALDAANVFTESPAQDEPQVAWLHWAAACYHRRKASGCQVELAPLRLVPILLATDVGSRERVAVGQEFIRKFLETANPSIREDMWIDLESVRQRVPIAARTAYAALRRRPSLLGDQDPKLLATILREALPSDHPQS